MRRRILLAALLAAACCAPVAAQAGKNELILFETPGCGYCKAWLRDVGPGYASSRSGAVLPLHRVDLSKGVPGDMRGMMPVRGVPTFVVRACNQEVVRFSGYSSKDRFYALLDAAVKSVQRMGC